MQNEGKSDYNMKPEEKPYRPEESTRQDLGKKERGVPGGIAAVLVGEGWDETWASSMERDLI